jgi:glycosyltransferase involved in cell wall biosynthesis
MSRAVAAAWHFSRLRRPISTSRASLYHSPSFPLITRQSVPTVWSVHDDIIMGGHQNYASRGTRYWKYPARHCLSFVDAIVTSTLSTARDLERAGANAAKIHVIHPAQPSVGPPSEAPGLVDATGTPVEFPGEFLLIVGTIEARKRPDLAAEIAANTKTPLVFVGRPRGIDPAALAGRPLFATNADDAQLSWCYEHARALLAVSAYEGIDLPLFEALSAGLPVIASPIEVHTELASGYVSFLADANPVGSAATALREAPERTKRSSPLSSPEELAQAHVELYGSLLSR